MSGCGRQILLLQNSHLLSLRLELPKNADDLDQLKAKPQQASDYIVCIYHQIFRIPKIHDIRVRSFYFFFRRDEFLEK